MNYDYAIYGMGPTGINLALEISRIFPDKKILCVEKEKKIGGCWKVEWQNGLFTEHSPRVLLDKELPKFFKKIGLDYDKETVDAYGDIFTTNYKMYKTYLSNFELNDIIKIIKSFIFKDYYGKTVSEWTTQNNISNKGRAMFKIASILVANSPDKLLMSELFESKNLILEIKQLKDNTKWLDIVENLLLQNKNITLLTNTELVYIKNHFDSVLETKTNLVHKYTNINSKIHILTLPPKPLYTFLLNQQDELKNNFGSIDQIKNIVDYGSYYSLGFQLHFDKVIKWRNQWCWSCFNDYNLIILPTSNYTKNFTKNSQIKTVWSCTIVSTDNFIKKRGKTVNNLTKKEIIEDVLEIINVKPKYITFYDGVKKESGKWISKDNSFNLSKYGIIKPKGKIPNIYSVGSHNTPGISTIGKAFTNSNNFINKYIKQDVTKSNKPNIIYYLLVLLLIAISMFKKQNAIYNLGVLLLIAIFVNSMYEKITNINQTYQLIVEKNIPWPKLATGFSIGIQLFAIYFILKKILFNSKHKSLTKLSIKGLIIFTVLTIYYFHNIFTDSTQKNHFYKNLSIIGGLLILHETI